MSDQMSQMELLALVDQAERDASAYNGEYMEENEKYLEYYLGEPFGDEQEGQSQVISTDVADVIESDMPSLARVFLGSNNIMEFEPSTSNPLDIQEAEQKTKYINWIISHQKNSFKVIHDWLKDAEIQKLGVVKFSYQDDQKKTQEVYSGLSEFEANQLISIKEADPSIIELEVEREDIIDVDSGTQVVDLTFNITKKDKKYVIENVPVESFLISSNAKSKDDAELVGDRVRKTRGELIAEGFDEELVRSLPTYTIDEHTNIKTTRFKDVGGFDEEESINHWASEDVEISDLYVKVDFDGDGIPERRRVLKSGNVILENEPHDMVPYAINSAILMPHNAIGRSRAEITMQTQRVKSTLYRQILDNIYRVNNGRVVVNDTQTNIDDLLTVRPNGIVRTEGDPRGAVAQLETPYIGDRALQVVQYVDSARAQTTGSLLANQGLERDKINKETATRFEGIADSAAAKVELVARVYAETGFRELFEGLAWLAQHFQDEDIEIMVMGEPLTISPKSWKFDQHLTSNVGLAAGDNSQILGNLNAVLAVQQQLLQSGSPIVDQSKLYNTLSRMARSAGLYRVDKYFNNPEIPNQLLQAGFEQLQQQNLILQQQLQQQNPLVEVEQVKAQANAQIQQIKSATQLQDTRIKEQSDIQQLLLKMEQDQSKMIQNQSQFNDELQAKLTELELKFNENVPGALV